ncbi:MAG: UDP-N-acetylmuramoyl-L-alanine--D-glutamate ligase [Alphaproteobacteria bacterium]|nr:UDP-N-acetylmuramoyl-L-alanine--D-glutamate ligase [Alphaproteobacteria bacterium SS10]
MADHDTIAIQADGKTAVLGLARSGLATIKALGRGDSKVVAWDDNEERRKEAAKLGAEIADLGSADFGDIETLVMAPGVPLTHPTPHPAVVQAKAGGTEIVGDIELLYRAQPAARYVGITGTNGKSTTTALIDHILRSAKPEWHSLMGGNIGQPVLDLPMPTANQPVVLELSSYQLDLTVNGVFSVACLLNVTPDHLDRHGGMEGYIEAKKRIFRRGAMVQHAVVGIDTAPTGTVATELERGGHWKVTRISSEGRVEGGVYVLNAVLYDDLDGFDKAICDLLPIETLPGMHNWQNAAAAFATCRHLGVEAEAIAEAIATFPGLAHRQQIVGRYKRITFVNDSKATNADAASKALGSYANIYWIAGGKAKDGGLNGLEGLVDRVEHAFLIGEAADDFAGWCDGKLESTISSTMDKAVEAATAMAVETRKPSIVLLSPACASFDQFDSFEQRGDVFAKCVEDTIRKRQQALEAQQ